MLAAPWSAIAAPTGRVSAESVARIWRHTGGSGWSETRTRSSSSSTASLHRNATELAGLSGSSQTRHGHAGVVRRPRARAASASAIAPAMCCATRALNSPRIFSTVFLEYFFGPLKIACTTPRRRLTWRFTRAAERTDGLLGFRRPRFDHVPTPGLSASPHQREDSSTRGTGVNVRLTASATRTRSPPTTLSIARTSFAGSFAAAVGGEAGGS
mmetsp:Transcript_2353/g.10422  ORF Transcript_2353/g.10422 Transcript_2353/m.10422 type:complete len:213 (+) Transcript_2353:1734-2372(+)